jgi:hypothetical protein
MPSFFIIKVLFHKVRGENQRSPVSESCLRARAARYNPYPFGFRGCRCANLSSSRHVQSKPSDPRVVDRALLERGDLQLRGVHALELAKLLSKRARVEHLAGDTSAAAAALVEAETIAKKIKAGPDSELGQELSKARAALTD